MLLFQYIKKLLIKQYTFFALGNVTEYTYDGAGQITAVTQKGKDGEDITISYAYDNLGNITTITDKSVAKNSPQTATDSTVQMEYDSKY